MEKNTFYYATGKRKTAVARTWITPGSGEITVNNRKMEEYFPVRSLQDTLRQPLVLTNNTSSYDIKIRVKGGGISGQAGAVRHSITKALLEVDPDLRGVLKKANFIKRDPRVKERKKYGQRGARARFQFSKR